MDDSDDEDIGLDEEPCDPEEEPCAEAEEACTEAACEEETSADRSLSLIQRLLSPFRRRKKGKGASQTAPIDHAPSRQRVLDRFQILHGSQASKASARLAVLRSLAAKLEELFRSLDVAGIRDLSVKALGEAMLDLHSLLGQNQPAETDILDVWTRIENVLRTWLERTPESELRREGFWK